MRTFVPAVFAAGLLAMSCAGVQAGDAPVAFWDFNDADLIPSEGSGTLHVSYVGIGISTVGYLSGTTLNAPEGVPAGLAIGFLDAVDLFSLAALELTLDTSGINGVGVSFALATDHLFQIGEWIRVYTSTGHGYTMREELAPPELGEWQVYNVDLPWLDDESLAKILIVAETTVDVGKYLKVDNLTVVPEPGTLGLLVAGGLAVAGAVLRRRRGC